MKKYLLLVLIILFLSSCTSEPSENQSQTAIANTESAKPTFTPTNVPTPTPSPAPIEYTVSLEIRSLARPTWSSGPWTIEWGKNGSISSTQLSDSDIKHEPKGIYYTLWTEEFTALQGDTIHFSVKAHADCVIVVDGEDVVVSTSESSDTSAVCEYQLP